MHDPQPPGTVIQTRYHLLRVLGQGGSGITYEAEDGFTGHHVALKELSLRGLTDWKKLDLFEREARVLAGLDHPAIPRYVDYFQIDTADNRYFYIAQEVAEGRSLAELVAAGERFSEPEVRRIALDVLAVLTYLHGLNPPIIHRDIKPQNIIRRDDGRIFLVDFGAVQTVYRDTMTFGSTVVGTYGYMAPEQFRGQAVPTTDLYGLGATLIHLLTHQAPSDLPQSRLKINFRPYVTVSEAFATWLDGMVEPLVEDRYPSAQAAIAALNNPRPAIARLPRTGAFYPHKKPPGSPITLRREGDRLKLVIPPSGLRGETLGIGCFTVFWLSFIALWTGGAVLSGAPIFFPLFSIPFWVVGLGMAGVVVNGLFGRVDFQVVGDRFTLTHQILFWRRVTSGLSRDLSGVELHTAYTQNSRPVEVITLYAGAQTLTFGTMLSRAEKEWLADELLAFIRQLPMP